jgi:hypothetical protein
VTGYMLAWWRGRCPRVKVKVRIKGEKKMYRGRGRARVSFKDFVI